MQSVSGQGEVASEAPSSSRDQPLPPQSTGTPRRKGKDAQTVVYIWPGLVGPFHSDESEGTTYRSEIFSSTANGMDDTSHAGIGRFIYTLRDVSGVSQH